MSLDSGERIRSSLVAYDHELKLGWHQHDEAVLVLNLNGWVRESVGNAELVGRPLQIGIKPPGIAHSDHFGPAGLRAIRVTIPGNLHAMLAEQAPALSRWGWLDHPPARRILLRSLEPNRTETDPTRLDDLMEALAALEQTREAASPRAMPPWIQDAVREIEAAFPMSPRLTDLAARTGVHRIYFARRFRQHLGCSVGTYIRRLRLRMAADALAHGRGSLAGTAQLAGFADQPHFTRVFRSETGFTPARYFRAVRTVGFHHSRPTAEPTSD